MITKSEQLARKGHENFTAQDWDVWRSAVKAEATGRRVKPMAPKAAAVMRKQIAGALKGVKSESEVRERLRFITRRTPSKRAVDVPVDPYKKAPLASRGGAREAVPYWGSL